MMTSRLFAENSTNTQEPSMEESQFDVSTEEQYEKGKRFSQFFAALLFQC